ncbi:hypothetical protein ACJX0J_041033, partial [Zea mays]
QVVWLYGGMLTSLNFLLIYPENINSQVADLEQKIENKLSVFSLAKKACTTDERSLHAKWKNILAVFKRRQHFVSKLKLDITRIPGAFRFNHGGVCVVSTTTSTIDITGRWSLRNPLAHMQWGQHVVQME